MRGTDKGKFRFSGCVAREVGADEDDVEGGTGGEGILCHTHSLASAHDSRPDHSSTSYNNWTYRCHDRHISRHLRGLAVLRHPVEIYFGSCRADIIA
jgi:hypothetical protein